MVWSHKDKTELHCSRMFNGTGTGTVQFNAIEAATQNEYNNSRRKMKRIEREGKKRKETK